MSATTVQQMADRVAQLMEERLRIRGAGLAVKLRRGGRVLPRKVRQQAAYLAEAAQMAQSPRLMMQLDETAIANAYDVCLQHLSTIGRAERRKAMAMGIVTSIAFSLLVVFALVVTVLVWRGYL